MKADKQREENTWCYFHPNQVVVGVCPLCLNERLLTVAAKQGHNHHHQHHRSFASMASHKKPSVPIHKIFAFGSLFSRPESQQLKSENFDYDASPSPEDSFISIKFEENGVASWEKNTVISNKVCHSQILNKDAKESKSMIEHRKPINTFRWRKRIGRLFHLIQWKRSTKNGVRQVGSKVEGVKIRKGWMRTLTKRTTME